MGTASGGYEAGHRDCFRSPGKPAGTYQVGCGSFTSPERDTSLLVSGASVSLSAQVVNGTPMALRINAGRNGFVLPY